MKSKVGTRTMRFARLSFLVIGLPSIALAQQAVSPQVKFQPLEIKLGLWETTTTIKTTGEMPIPAGTLEKLTPEQRARLQERMSANSGGHTQITNDKHCVTREDMEQQKLQVTATKECRPTVVTSTKSLVKGKFWCEVEGMKGNGTFEAEALDAEHVTGSGRGSVSGNGHTLNFDDTFSAKWIGSACGNVK